METEAGWRIVWDPFEDPAKVRAREASMAAGPQGSRMLSFGAGSLALGGSAARRMVRSSLDFLSSLHLPFTRGGDASGGQTQPQQEQQGGAGTAQDQPAGAPAPDSAGPAASAVVLRPAGPATARSAGFVSPFATDSSSGDSSALSASLRAPSSVQTSNGGTAAGPFAAQAQQPLAEVQAKPQAHVSIGIPEGSPTAGGQHRSVNISQVCRGGVVCVWEGGGGGAEGWAAGS